MTEFPQTSKSRRRRFAPLAVVAGVGATAALALSMTGTLSAFTAQITNTANTVSDGTLVMTETQGSGAQTVTCTSTTGTSAAVNQGTCSTINKYGGATTLVPGGTSTATITISNTGNAAASTFTLEPGMCSQDVAPNNGGITGGATDLCSKLTVAITKTISGTTSPVLPATTLDAFYAANKTGGTSGPIPVAGTTGTVAPGGSVTFNFTVTLPSGTGNAYQGLLAKQNLTWFFSAGS